MDTGIRGPVLAKAIRAAASDRHVKAIVLRADSPGGEILPSDLVAREMRDAAKKKPVLVSQGQVAASGGYWISMNADTIVASPLTITGSIGVIGGWVWNKSLGAKIGFDYDGVKRGEHSDALNGITLPLIGQTIPERPLTADERDRVEQLIRSSYKDFVGKVAAGRGLEESRVDAIGQGHVYSGTRGRELGLVDEIGGLWTTIALAKRAANIAVSRRLELTTGPVPGLVDLSGLRPRLIGALLGRSNAAAPDVEAVNLVSTPLLSRTELDFLRTLVRSNGKPLVLIDPLEIHDGSPDR
jgi:protease-4